MIVITDSNIIFSYLINPNGTIAEILKGKNNIQLLTTEYLLDEVENHIEKIESFSPFTKTELKKELSFLKERIKIYDVVDIPKKYVAKAESILIDIDIDDKYFVALYFYTKHKIWTGDRVLINGLKKKGYNICITTTELKKSLYKK
ncbi:MAG: PIN domain-containing protein [Flavobacteriaceae bacterium]